MSSAATVGANIAPQQQQQQQQHPFPPQQPPHSNSAVQAHTAFSANAPPPSIQSPAMSAPASVPSPTPASSARVVSPPVPSPVTAAATMAATTSQTTAATAPTVPTTGTTATNTPVLTPTLAPAPVPPTLAPAPSYTQQHMPQQHAQPSHLHHLHQQHSQHQHQSASHHASPQLHSMSSSSLHHSFSLSQPTPSFMAAPPSYRRSFSDMSARFSNDGPGIYSAVYSGVDVYEMEVNSVAVMRRRADSWLNATQILKVAGVDKGKRTKILEKEIQTGEHEKVQGGYGKYQGTWIKFERGVEVCQQYGVEELLRPLLTYDMGQDGGIAGRGDINTPTKEQAMAAQRKRTMYASQEARQGGISSTFFKSISTTASQAVAAMSKGRFDPTGMRNRVPSQPPAPRPSFSRQSSMQNADDLPSNSQQSAVTDYNDQPYGPPTHAGADEPPRKKQRMVTPAGSFSYGGAASIDGYPTGVFPPPSPSEFNDSFYHGSNGNLVHGDAMSGKSLPPLPFDTAPEAERARQQMVHLFLGSDMTIEDVVGKLPPAQIDMPIDALCNNALHYAATLARVKILSTLVSLGGNVWRVNADGDTPLMRAVMVTNSSDCSLFAELLEIIGCTLDARDNKGRTVLHKIALASGLKGRANSSKYYLESLLEWVVRSGSQSAAAAIAGTTTTTTTTTTNNNQVAPPNNQRAQTQNMNLARFINEIVDAQDDCGDTALMIAARIGNKSIISQLLEVGADANIANRVGLRPTTFGVGTPSDQAPSESTAMAEATNAAAIKSKETSDEILSTISTLLGDSFTTSQQELRAKQESINNVHAELEIATAKLAEARRKAESLQTLVRQERLDRQKISNLSQARENFQSSTGPNGTKKTPPPFDPATPQPISAWEKQITAILDAAAACTSPSAPPAAAANLTSMLPSARVLNARIKALLSRREDTNHMAAAMRSRSRETEEKYRKLVSLCSHVKEADVDNDLDGLLKAVESESSDLEISRVRRFLGSVAESA